MSTTPRNCLIPLKDGATLAVSIVLPEGDGPFPALMSFYPYRKDDFIGASAAWSSAYFAEAGYASVLVDIRGHGSSSGRSYQAWDPREFDDAADAVAWAARQDWCNGKVGVWGTSYGGAHALGVATKRPPALKAIASIYGAGDPYADFVYPGGCPNGLGAAAWTALVVAMELAPPSLQDRAGRWREVWRDRLQRLEDGEIPALIWPSHTGLDDYWRARQIPIEKCTAPCFFLTGWRDLLCQGMVDVYQRYKAPKRLLAGPWSHAAPDQVQDAPYDWLRDMRAWFDRWLCDKPDERTPDVVYYVQQAQQWRSAESFPPNDSSELEHFPATDGALSDTVQGAEITFDTPALVGVEAGLWYPMGLKVDAAFDQSRDDAQSTCFTSTPLAQDLEITGAPHAALHLEAINGKDAHVAVKLCDVSPSGRSTLITSGWTRIAAGAQPQLYDIDLYPTAYLVPRGHCLRWTIAASDFPRLWPTAEQPTLVLRSSASAPSRFSTPARQPDGAGAAPWDAPQPATGVNRTPWLKAGRPICTVERDQAEARAVVTAGVDLRLTLPQGGEFAMRHSVCAEMAEKRASAAVITTQARIEVAFASGETVEINTRARSMLGRRYVSGEIRSDGELIFEKRWRSLNR